MKIIVSLLVHLKNNTILASHLLRGNGQRACKCRLTRLNIEKMEAVPIFDSEESWNLCADSRKELNKELEKLKVWTDGRPTTY